MAAPRPPGSRASPVGHRSRSARTVISEYAVLLVQIAEKTEKIEAKTKALKALVAQIKNVRLSLIVAPYLRAFAESGYG